MLTKLGVTVVVALSVALFYVVNQDQDEVDVFGMTINVGVVKRALFISNSNSAEIRRVVEREKRATERAEAERKRRNKEDAEKAKERQKIAEENKRFEEERKRLEAAKKEKKRLEAERKEMERLEAERKEKERLEAERKEKERLEAERKEKERLEAERKEMERLEAERKEKERLEAERKEKERLETERKEKDRLEAERKEMERLEAERKEMERLEAEKKENERLEANAKTSTQEAMMEAETERLEETIGGDAEFVAKQDVLQGKDDGKKADNKIEEQTGEKHEAMHLAVVACGDRLEETLVMIKSALMFSRAMLHVHIFSDADLQPQFRSELDKIPDSVKLRFEAHIHDIQFPAGYKEDEWRKMFKTCATQRLFIPDILMDVKRLIYVDTDILFMRPLEDIWDFFYEFNETQIAAVSWEHEDGSAGWYNRFARHPYYPPFGVNSGVMLMDLPGLRANQWTTLMKEYYGKYQYNLTWGDQDLINIFFHYYPEKLFIFNCVYNYRPDHCMYMQNCRRANTDGISVLHGNRGTLHNEKQVMFRAVYRTFKQHELSEPLDQTFLKQMRNNLEDPDNVKDRCHQERHIFTIQLAKTIKTLR